MYKYATTVIIPNIKLDTFSLDNNQTFIIPITEAKISIILEFIENPTNKHIAHATTTNIGLQVYEVNFSLIP